MILGFIIIWLLIGLAGSIFMLQYESKKRDIILSDFMWILCGSILGIFMLIMIYENYFKDKVIIKRKDIK